MFTIRVQSDLMCFLQRYSASPDLPSNPSDPSDRLSHGSQHFYPSVISVNGGEGIFFQHLRPPNSSRYNRTHSRPPHPPSEFLCHNLTHARVSLLRCAAHRNISSIGTTIHIPDLTRSDQRIACYPCPSRRLRPPSRTTCGYHSTPWHSPRWPFRPLSTLVPVQESFGVPRSPEPGVEVMCLRTGDLDTSRGLYATTVAGVPMVVPVPSLMN